MDSSDEIIVASSGRKPRDIAPAASVVAGGRNANSEKVSHADHKTTSKHSSAPASSNIIDLTQSSSPPPSPLSDVDEGVLVTAPTVKLQQLASETGTSPRQASTDSTSSSADPLSLDPNTFNSSPPLPPSSRRSLRKRDQSSDTMSAVGTPPAKRRPGRPSRAAAPKDFKLPKVTREEDTEEAVDSGLDADTMSASEELPAKRRPGRPSRASALKDLQMPRKMNGDKTDEAVVGELDLDTTEDDLGVRPARKYVVGGADPEKVSRKSTVQRFLNREEEGPTRPRRKTTDRVVESEEYEPLHLYEQSNWVLFDPVRGFPLSLVPPEFLQRFAHYKPGNVKVLEYNLISDSIRLRVTPQILKDKVVRYDEEGPRIE